MQLSLRAAREKKGWSIEQLAMRSGVNKSTISRLERGETQPMHDTVNQLEDAMGLTRGTLIFNNVPEKRAVNE
jgi:transcriptional regulator with XRE-family HTH domain